MHTNLLQPIRDVFEHEPEFVTSDALLYLMISYLGAKHAMGVRQQISWQRAANVLARSIPYVNPEKGREHLKAVNEAIEKHEKMKIPSPNAGWIKAHESLCFQRDALLDTEKRFQKIEKDCREYQQHLNDLEISPERARCMFYYLLNKLAEGNNFTVNQSQAFLRAYDNYKAERKRKVEQTVEQHVPQSNPDNLDF